MRIHRKQVCQTVSELQPTPLREHCPTVYGPVQSRRHGLSLGINLGDPESKLCTWSCIYCQCGFGHRIESGQARSIPAVLEVVQGVKKALVEHPHLDSITIAGNSEPTTHPQFLEIVKEILTLRNKTGANWTFNCLSNGSELSDPTVIEACNLLDEIWIKIDAGIDPLFRKFNRPVAKVGTIAAHLDRIRCLKAPRIQTLFWISPGRPELSNWTQENREALVECYQHVRPTQIFITTVDRKPAYNGLEAVAEEDLERFAARVQSLGFHVKVFG